MQALQNMLLSVIPQVTSQATPETTETALSTTLESFTGTAVATTLEYFTGTTLAITSDTLEYILATINTASTGLSIEGFYRNYVMATAENSHFFSSNDDHNDDHYNAGYDQGIDDDYSQGLLHGILISAALGAGLAYLFCRITTNTYSQTNRDISEQIRTLVQQAPIQQILRNNILTTSTTQEGQRERALIQLLLQLSQNEAQPLNLTIPILGLIPNPEQNQQIETQEPAPAYTDPPAYTTR